MSAPRIEPGPSRRAPSRLDPELRQLFEGLLRLRVLTSFQAHWLVEGFHAPNPATGRPLTERNTRKRLAQLVEDGLLEADELHPEKGGFSGYYYRLSHRALAVMRSDERHSVRPPPRHVLRSLVLRNEVYARARAEGWTVISPTLSDEALHPTLLGQVHDWMRASLEQGARAGDADCEEKLRELPALLPAQLTFDCLLRGQPEGGRSDFILCVVDDICRAISPRKQRTPRTRKTDEPCPLCGQAMTRFSTPRQAVLRCTVPRCTGERELPAPTLAQVEELPRHLFGGSVLLRDAQSVLNVADQQVTASVRLCQWRKALAARYGEAVLQTETLFPDVWADRRS